jgi:excisionase family DNA binding protein
MEESGTREINVAFGGEKMLSPAELADLLNVSPISVYKWVRLKQIPFYHLSRVVRFNPVEIREWLEGKKNVAAPMPRRLKR